MIIWPQAQVELLPQGLLPPVLLLPVLLLVELRLLERRVQWSVELSSHEFIR